MPRPKSKSELLQISQENFERLFLLIDSFSQKEKTNVFPEGTLNRNIRDVLGHLLEWQLMMLKWYEVGMSGQKPAMPTEGFTWQTVSQLNQNIWKKYSKVSLKKVRSELTQSHIAIQKIIQEHTNEDLFEKKKYKWTGSTSLGSYIISATSSHYNWAIKLIKKAKK